MGACIPKQLPSTPLSIDSLLMAKNSLETDNQEADEMLRACLEQAIHEFPREPRRVQNNAILTIQVKGKKRMEFVSGGGENKIVVSWLKRKTYYNIEIPNLSVYLDRMTISPPLLTSESLQKVKQELMKWDDATKELCTCLDVALTEIEKEPSSVKNDAELTIECGGSCLDFISGKGKSNIYIHYTDRHPRYKVHVSSVDVYLDRFSYRPLPLTSENLLKVWKDMENLKGCTVDLQACLKRALQEFNTLSPHHRANATVFIDCDGNNFKMVSGHGESWISIFNIVGDQHCRREVVLALGERASSSRTIGSFGRKRGKEGSSFRVKKSEEKRGAEEGPSSQGRRASNKSAGPSDEKRSKRRPSNVAELEDFASSGSKMVEETTSLVGRALSNDGETDAVPSSSSQALEKEHSLGPKVSTKKRKMSHSSVAEERELGGQVGLPSETATEVWIYRNNKEVMKERESCHTSSDEEEEKKVSPDILELSSDS